MPQVTIFLDEAGFTGDDLASREQPVFVVASHQIPDEVCRGLLKSFFPDTQAAELKHSNVRKYRRSQHAQIELVKAIQQQQLPTAIYPVHKRFALFQRLFDYLVEPVLYEAGFNVYRRAMNIELTNRGYLEFQAIEERHPSRILDEFQEAVRQRSATRLKSMWQQIEQMKSRGTRRFGVADLLLMGNTADDRHFESIPQNALDVAFSVLFAITAHWRRKSEGPFTIIHDRSTSLVKQRHIWDWLSSPEQQVATLGHGDYRDCPLPLNITTTEFADSREHAGLQVADLLAGGHLEICRYVLGEQTNAGYAKSLMDAGLDEVVSYIWPNPSWSQPESKNNSGAIDPLDFFMSAPARESR